MSRRTPTAAVEIETPPLAPGNLCASKLSRFAAIGRSNARVNLESEWRTGARTDLPSDGTSASRFASHRFREETIDPLTRSTDRNTGVGSRDSIAAIVKGEDNGH